MALQSDSQSHSDVDLTPMLDVIFIILIFFIVSASFVKESGIALNKPAPNKSESPQAAIVLQVSAAGAITIQDRAVDLRAVRPTIIRMMAESPAATVTVRLHRHAKTRDVISAIDALHAARVVRPPISLIES